MPLPEKDPFPLATDWQAVARLIANIYHKDSKSFDMGDCYFSHPFPQIMHSLIYSIMTGTAHDVMPFLTLLRKSNNKLLSYESSSDFNDALKIPSSEGLVNYAVTRDYQEHGKQTYLVTVHFNNVFSRLSSYYIERLRSQCDIELSIDFQKNNITIPHRISSDDILLPANIQERLEARAKVMSFLVNGVIFPTLVDNGFNNTAQNLYRLLVRDYNMPADCFELSFDVAEQSGKKRDLTGYKFGHLHVVCEEPQRSKSGHVLWDCVCDCGQHVPGVVSSDLTSWRAFSCGKCHLKGINEATLTKARTKAKRAYYGAEVSCAKRATDYAERHAARDFDRNVNKDFQGFLGRVKRSTKDSLFLLPRPTSVSVVAGLPLEGEKNQAHGTSLDLHRSGHERLLDFSIMMPYATSTICWVPAPKNKKQSADENMQPYSDGPPEVKARPSTRKLQEAVGDDLD